MSTSIDFSSQALSTDKTALDRLSEVLSSWRQKRKTHHYKASDADLLFFLEEDIENVGVFYMTAQKSGVKANDIIQIHSPSGPVSYVVMEIEFYSTPPEMWQAKLEIAS